MMHNIYILLQKLKIKKYKQNHIYLCWIYRLSYLIQIQIYEY